MGLLARAALIGLGAYGARAALRTVRAQPQAGHLARTNFRGNPVTLAGGPALAVSASVTSALGAGDARTAAAALAAGLTGGGVGLYDDIVGARPDQKADKGFRGHLRALREGRVTSGLVKIAGVGAGALVAAALLPDRRGRGRLGRAAEVALGAGVIAGSANLMNLLDLRPGRALKAGVLVGLPLTATRAGGLAAGPVGASVGLLPDDLGEEIMLGDSGANALGALLGVAATARTGLLGRATLLAGLAALTAASERVSFSKVIASTPVLREIDEWGRIPADQQLPKTSRAADPDPAQPGPAVPAQAQVADVRVGTTDTSPAEPAARQTEPGTPPPALGESDHATDAPVAPAKAARTAAAAKSAVSARTGGAAASGKPDGTGATAEPTLTAESDESASTDETAADARPRPRARAPRRTAQ